jgi:hypothetical protein
MSSYSTLSLNMSFKKETPPYVTDFFHKGLKNKRLPAFLYDFDFTFPRKIDLSCPNTYLCEYTAKTYIDNVPNNRYYLSILQESDIDRLAEVYALLATLAGYAEDNFMAGYIKHEGGDTDLFAFEGGYIYWLQGFEIEKDKTKKDGKLDYFELLAIGQKIKNSEGNELEINDLMTQFDKSVPHPQGSSLFFYPENYNAKSKIDISKYDPSVEEVVQICLNYEPLKLETKNPKEKP